MSSHIGSNFEIIMYFQVQIPSSGCDLAVILWTIDLPNRENYKCIHSFNFLFTFMHIHANKQYNLLLTVHCQSALLNRNMNWLDHAITCLFPALIKNSAKDHWQV